MKAPSYLRPVAPAMAADRPLSRRRAPSQPERKGPASRQPRRRDLRAGNEAGEPLLLLTVEQARRRMQCGRAGIYQLINSGELASVKLGGCRRIPVSAVEDWITGMLDRSRGVRTLRGAGGGRYGA